jgi:enamine deaminase RidA (YjgF/YER057c/UK114 family)
MTRIALEPDDYPFLDYRRFTFSLAVMAGGAAWLSGSTAVRHDPVRGMVVEGGLLDQARLVQDKMRATLVPAGLGLADMLRVVEYITPAALQDLPALAAQRRDVYPHASVSTILVRSLLRPAALIEIEGVAGRAGTGATYLPSATAPDADTAWLTAAEALSGRPPARALCFVPPGDMTAAPGLRVVMPRSDAQLEFATSDGRVVFASAAGDPDAGDVVAQCRAAYARIARDLARQGLTLDHVVKTTEFVTPAGLAAYRGTAEVRREVFAPPFPAATGVICEALPTPGALIAVEAVAVRP